jgi:sporulation protein YlmC with PRC-barrel domain
MLQIEDIIGLEVLSADGKVVGFVEGIGINTDSWTAPIIKIAVKKGNEELLGLKKPLFSTAKFYFETSYIASVADVMTLVRKLNSVRELTVDGSLVQSWAGDIMLKRVVCDKSIEIGIVDNILIDNTVRNWAIPMIQVKVDKDTLKGMKLKKGAMKGREVKIPANMIRTVGDIVILRISHDDLKHMIEASPGY